MNAYLFFYLGAVCGKKTVLSGCHRPVIYLDVIDQAGLVSAQARTNPEEGLYRRAGAGPETARLGLSAGPATQRAITSLSIS